MDGETASLGDLQFYDGFPGGGEMGSSVEILSRLKLDLACVSEKIINLFVLVMHVDTMENDFEAFASERERASDGSFVKALEFDFLSGVLDSEARDLDGFMAVLQSEIAHARELISSCEREEGKFEEMKAMLCDSEKSFEDSQDQISELKAQSVTLQKMLSSFNREENRNSDKKLGEDQFFNPNANIKMQTVEQQRHILRELEKSLAREMDLEKKLTELRQTDEELKQRVIAIDREVYCLEDETSNVSGRWFEAENNAVVLKGISEELLGRLHILQFNVNGSVVRETQLSSKLEDTIEELRDKECSLNTLEANTAEVNSLKASLREAEDKLVRTNSEVFTLSEKVSLLEKQLKGPKIHLKNGDVEIDGNQKQHDKIGEIEDLKEKKNEAESRANNVEAKCRLLTETNMELNEELSLLKSGVGASDEVESRDRLSREADIQLQRAIAAAEASQEKHELLSLTIKDMQHLIDDLKLKVVKHEKQTNSAEEKCIILSESNAELSDELSFLRGRLESLEASLQQADENKLTAAKGVGLQTKVVKNLVLQLACERNRLHKQISSLGTENKRLVQKLQENINNKSAVTNHGNGGNDENCALPKHGLATAACSDEYREKVVETSSVSSKQLEETQENVSLGKTEVKSTTDPETVRRIDAGVLSLKHVFFAVLILPISVAIYYSFQLESCPF